MDSDYIPYLILKTYMKKTNAYFIVSWDKDYIQLLVYSNLFIYRRHNIKVKNELIGDYVKVDYKILTGKNLDIKLKHPLLHPIYLALAGDSSDNIPSVFPKCGPKTAQKCVEDPEFFKKKMDNNPEYYAQYELNKKLVSFENIPEDLVKEFMSTIKK